MIVLLGILVIFWEILFCLRKFLMVGLKGTATQVWHLTWPSSGSSRSTESSFIKSLGSEDSHLPRCSPLWTRRPASSSCSSYWYSCVCASHRTQHLQGRRRTRALCPQGQTWAAFSLPLGPSSSLQVFLKLEPIFHFSK